MSAPFPVSNMPRLRNRSGGWIKRLVVFVLAGLIVLYLGGAAAGFLFVRYVRKNSSITFLDVAFLRWREVRRGMAAEQFAKAKAEWNAGNYQVAFLAFNFAVNNDPANIPGRLNAARFLQAAGSVPMALSTLEAGLARTPDDTQLIERTFDLLLATGRDQRALELLRQRPASSFSGPEGTLLRTYELEARLNMGEVDAAKKLLEQHPELAKQDRARPVVARLLWDSKERLRAIEMLASQTRNRPSDSGVMVQLAQWQLAAGMADDAMRTAELAIAKSPGDLTLRMLLLEALAVRTSRGSEWNAAVTSYLKEFGDRPEALRQLAALAGRRGWVDLARALYDLGALREPDLSGLGLAYCDALTRQSRFREAQQVLTQIDSQALDGSPPFMIQLRTRQVLVAAALADTATVREFSKRLSATVRNDSGTREVLRRTLQKAGIAEAVAELSDRVSASPVTVVRN